MLARLSNIVVTEENMHLHLPDGVSRDLEVYPGADLQMKVRLRDRTLPLTMVFTYADEKRSIMISHS